MVKSSLVIRLRIIAALVITMFSTGCWFDAHNQHLAGPYRLSAIDTDDQMSVYYDLGDGSGIGRINETVFSVGWDKTYLVAKQHPDGNRNVTHYYILDMAKDSAYASPSASVSGPLTAAEYFVKAQELKLPPFSVTIQSLE